MRLRRRSSENEASAAAGGLGPREQPESVAIDARKRINSNRRCDLTGCMNASVAAGLEGMATPLHSIPRRGKRQRKPNCDSGSIYETHSRANEQVRGALASRRLPCEVWRTEKLPARCRRYQGISQTARSHLQSTGNRPTLSFEVNCGFSSAGAGSARESRRIAGRRRAVQRGRDRRGGPHRAPNVGKSSDVFGQAALLVSRRHRGRSPGRSYHRYLTSWRTSRSCLIPSPPEPPQTHVIRRE